MLKIHQLQLFNDNYSYVLVCPETGEAAVVDPGHAEPILQFLEKNDIRLNYILCTHHHADHIGGNCAIKSKTGCRIIGSAHDRDRISGIDTGIWDGDFVSIGKCKSKVFLTPGHTRGHICYYFADDEALFCGDTLFSVGCGRLFEGSAQDMHWSLQKLAALPNSTRVYCGHEYTRSNIQFALSVDPDNEKLQNYRDKVYELCSQKRPTVPSTMALEKNINPFLRCNDRKIRKLLGREQAKEEEIFGELRRRKDNF